LPASTTNMMGNMEKWAGKLAFAREKISKMSQWDGRYQRFF